MIRLSSTTVVGVCPLLCGEPRHEPEIAMARLQMDATFGDPGYATRSICEAFDR